MNFRELTKSLNPIRHLKSEENNWKTLRKNWRNNHQIPFKRLQGNLHVTIIIIMLFRKDVPLPNRPCSLNSSRCYDWRDEYDQNQYVGKQHGCLKQTVSYNDPEKRKQKIVWWWNVLLQIEHLAILMEMQRV